MFLQQKLASDSKTHGVFALLGNGLALGRFRQKSSKTQGNLSKIGIRLFFRSFCGSSELLCSLRAPFRNGQNARDIRKFHAGFPRQALMKPAWQKHCVFTAKTGLGLKMPWVFTKFRSLQGKCLGACPGGWLAGFPGGLPRGPLTTSQHCQDSLSACVFFRMSRAFWPFLEPLKLTVFHERKNRSERSTGFAPFKHS